MKTNRRLWKYILFTAITCGIWTIFFYGRFGRDINKLAAEQGAKKQIGFFPALLLGLVTFGIVPIVWTFKLYNRVYVQAGRAGVTVKGSFVFYLITSLFLGWTVVCPFIAEAQALKTANHLGKWYNEKKASEAKEEKAE